MIRIRINRHAFGVKKLAVVFGDERFALINVYGLGLWIFRDAELFKVYQAINRLEV